MNSNPYESPVSVDHTDGATKEPIRVRVSSMMGLAIGASIGAAFFGVCVASVILRPQYFPLEGPSQKALMGFLWLALIVGGAFFGGSLGRKLRV